MNFSNITEINNVGILVYGRFPTEKAYGTHIVEVAKAFVNNHKKVTIFYSKTNNKYTIDENPQTFYDVPENIEIIALENFDYTNLRIFSLLPSIVKKLMWNLGAFFWAKKISPNLIDMDLVWSTNPNLLVPQKKLSKLLIYEKHGAAKYLQRLSIVSLSRYSNVVFVSTSKKSHDELKKINSSKTIYLPNGVDLSRYTNEKANNDTLNIGYIGMLETYGKSKGVEEAVKTLCDLKLLHKFNLTIIGGPSSRIKAIREICSENNIDAFIKDRVPYNEVAFEMQKLDIGIIPYPDDLHMSLYASPLKFFEYAAAGAAILCSDLNSHLDLKELNLGVEYFEESNWKDFESKIARLLEDRDYLEQLKLKSKKNIKNYSWEKRFESLMEFSVRSSIG
tara:strand:- start:2454 stop:3629 length:1176 start_codon:yes stop_codon:yes gene_type:complete